MTGYVKSFDKTDGVDTINSGDFEAEFNAIQSAFDQTSGHKHDGTASEGPYIQFISDSANKNKVVTDGSNNEIEFWNNASGLAVQQLSLTDGLLAPVTTNDVDLGSTIKAFKNVYSTKHGNDIFADGYTSLQAALNAATAFSTVHLRGQTYTLTSALTLSSLADITIQGPGKITTANDIVSIDISSCNRIRIKDVTLTSTHSSPSTGTGIKILNSLNVWVDNCYSDGHLIGVLCADSSDQHEVYINNCLIQTTNKAGSIGIRSITGDNLFTNNVIRGYETGISVERGTHLIYYNHIYKSPSSTYNYSIDLKPYGSYGVNNVILIGNQFDNPAAAAIRFEDCDNIWEVVCIGNLFYLWQYDIPAIIFDGSGTLIDTIIRNNQFAKSGTVLTTTINPGTATLGNGVIINQNTFTNCPDYATPEYLSTFGSGSTLPLVLDSMPAGAGAAFDSVGIKTRHKNASSATKITGDIVWALQDATASSEDVDIRLDAMVAGTLTEVGRFRGTPGSTQGLRIGTGAGGEGAWNNYHLMLGAHHLWLDTQDNLRIKASAPTSETDGLIIGPSSTFINVKTYGAMGDGSTDDTTDITTAITDAQAAGLDLVFPPGTYKITSGLTWNLSKGSFLATGHVILDFSSMSSGNALTLNVTGTTRGTYQPWRHRVSGFTFKGPTAGATTIDGIVLDGTAGNYILIENCTIYGFRDQIYMSDQAYINTFRHISFSMGVRYGINCASSGSVNGEKITLEDCAFDGPTNATDTAVAVYLGASIDAQVYAHNTSFDFCDSAVHILDGMFTANQCHFEMGTDNPIVKIESSGSSNPCHVSFNQCLIRGSDGGSKPESTNGRPAMIEAITNSDHVYVGIQDCQIHRNNDYNTEIVKNTAGGKIRVAFEGTNEIRGMQANLGPIICTDTNLINNGGFESSDFSNWTIAGGGSTGFTWSVDGTVANSGTYSAKAVVVAGTTNSGAISQAIAVTPGRSLYIRWYGKATIVAGVMSVRTRYRDYAGNLIYPDVILTYSTITATTDWVLRTALQYIPAGAVSATIECYAYPGATIEGTFYWDDVQAWVI